MKELEEKIDEVIRLLTSNNQKQILTLKECAEFIGLSESYVYQLTSKGEIPCYRPNGKKLYFNRTEIEGWLLRNRNKTNDEIVSEVATKCLLGGKGDYRA